MIFGIASCKKKQEKYYSDEEESETTAQTGDNYVDFNDLEGGDGTDESEDDGGESSTGNEWTNIY